ncbi:hypothetical protein ACH5RR_036597 [Cinchona calisaya]|uniref:Uncharacterized protein n=1 Tax=Cinchona calisaya TaxID=153742 RepID=A0ABD2Y4Y4_9GENT
MVLMKFDVMEAYLRDNESNLGKLRSNVNADEALEPYDVLSKQMLDCTTSDLVIEVAIYALVIVVEQCSILYPICIRIGLSFKVYLISER